MPNPCEGTWNDFQIIPDKTGTSVLPAGAKLRIVEDSTTHRITGHILGNGTDRDEFLSGRCIILSTNSLRARMNFYMLFDGVLYFFTGIVRVASFGPPKQATVEGVFVVQGIGSNTLVAAELNSDPGDTGGWGGNQGN